MKNVNKGAAKTVFSGYTWEDSFGDENGKKNVTQLEKGFNKSFRFGEKIYTLKVVEGVSETNEPILVLLLESGEKSQIIHYDNSIRESVGALFWVGDLDGDDELDLYMYYYDYEKDGNSTSLFLSTEAAKDKLVGKYTFFMTGSDC